MLSSNDFNILRNNGFAETYHCVENAMKYYYSDPIVSCGLFRKALESVIEDVYSIIGEKTEGNNKRDIENITNIVPGSFYDSNIILEMHNIRIIGNAYMHNENEERDVNTDRMTCYVAMKKISQWLVSFKKSYPAYLKEKELRAKQKKENRKAFLKKAGKIIGAAVAVAGAILGGVKISKK